LCHRKEQKTPKIILEKRSGIKIILFVLLTTCLALLLFSTFQLVIKNSFIPYLVVFGATLFGSIGFTAVLFSALKGIQGTVLTLYTLINVLLFAVYYFYPETLKEFYAFSLWSLCLIVLYSLQQAIQRYKISHAHITKFLNYGLIFALLPFMIFKIGHASLWFVISLLTGFILLVNLIVFLLPRKWNEGMKK
jgi:hypothetical protein